MRCSQPVGAGVTGGEVGAVVGPGVGSGVGDEVGSGVGAQMSVPRHSSAGFGYSTMQHCSRVSNMTASGAALSALVHPSDTE